ncbi:hypothetical protein [Niallia sp. 03133]|uniref:hypothetical protein n=1 Tax=Niallia sp. 03133 TaxID=3458060 RepID=UPI0040444869
MNIQSENKLYDMYYENKTYSELQFRRLDWIGSTCYITFQQARNGAWFTFEYNKVNFSRIKEKNLVS